jgi:hypothetical protein
MPNSLTGSVGLGGHNARPDVVSVQTLLVKHGERPGQADGLCGTRTIAAIRAFQAKFMRLPDGRVDVNGQTWKRLSAGMNGGKSTGESGFTAPFPRPAPGTFNRGLVAVSNKAMTEMFGSPRDSYSQDCQPLTADKLKHNVITDTVGMFRATGLGPAVNSLKQVFTQIAQTQPDLYPKIATAGMLCCRFQRGSTTTISNHSWGTAIDLTIGGLLDKRGDNLVQHGLTLIAPIFNQFGWYWGAMFPTEDAMHFEASTTLAQTIKAQLK